MNRCRAQALALVNWRGVFYQRYLLDPQVTALEGTNGAGKTTVLIGCYVVLLPDMTRLRFTNLGEHAPAGNDRGLWGRLGESSRPAYAVLELAPEPGRRLLAGVHLQRKTEPTVELTPFLITDVDDTVQLQDLLLERGELDGVPELAQLRDQVAGRGAVMQVFSTAKDYFAALFERGITPLRLASDNDRNKLNEMLRTSMTGGISRALTSDLCDFLLKEEAGLADTLKRMRSNLDACRRTRNEVERSRKLEHEIAGVYEAGQEMFAAALHATRERADELHRRFEQASRSAEEARHLEQALTTELNGKKLEGQTIDQSLNEAERQLSDARQFLEQIKRAQVIHRRLTNRKQELDGLQQNHADAISKKQQAETERTRARRARDEAQSNLESASASLADWQKGLEELQRRAYEHRQATQCLDRARQLLDGRPIDADRVADALAETDQRFTEASKQNRQLFMQLHNAEQHRAEFGQVYDALRRMSEADIEPADAYRHASETCRELRSLEALAAGRDALVREIRDAKKLAEQQDHARASAAELSTETDRIAASTDVTSAFDQTDAAAQSLDQRRREDEEKAHDAGRECSSLNQQKASLERALAVWNEALDRARPLEQQYERTLRTRPSLETLRRILVDKRDDQRDQLRQRLDQRQQLTEEAARLEQSGGSFPASLLRACEAVDGELLATRFEELTVEQASEIEALLGPLAHALVVDDPAAAAGTLSELEESPDSVWLVGGEDSPKFDPDGRPAGTIQHGHATVHASTGWRVSRIPPRPTLGRLARARRISELREESRSCTQQIEHLEADLRESVNHLETVLRLLTDADALEHGDPTDELHRVTTALDKTTATQQSHRQSAARLAEEAVSMKSRRSALRELFSSAWLLDAPDQQERIHELYNQQDQATNAAHRLQHVAEDRSIVESQMELLRTPPRSPAEVAAMRSRLAELEEQQETLCEARKRLRYVDEHRAALTWTDAAAALQHDVELEPALQAQLEQARAATQSTQAAFNHSETLVEEAFLHFNKIDSTVNTLTLSIEQDEQEWQACEVNSATEMDVRDADRAVRRAEFTDKEVKAQARAISEQIARLDERRHSAGGRTIQRVSERDEAERDWLPNRDRWDRLEALAIEHGVLSSAMAPHFLDRFGGRGSANARTEAKQAAAQLKERLAVASDSTDVEQAVNEFLGMQELAGDSCLGAWLAVRDWLKRRTPAQIADVADPVQALERLRSHLDGLELRLGRQEADLRGESSDVASNIDSHVRRAQRQISKLNRDLLEVRFGSIRGVRLRLERVEDMGRILRALRDGEAQSLLFQPDMPLESAIQELFRRYGGTGKTTGQRLLDYREYVEPKVEVRRQSSELWEAVNPTRMSTGEAIGIGAALMMVVLTAWERDANLLRPRHPHGTLRLLFLDEANRLSQDNLVVLFDLCQSLELQLIIAAPEVADARGNTTYHLVRRLSKAGNDEVVVTGRRLAAERST